MSVKKNFTIKVKHIIEYLSTLDPEMDTCLDHDGWNYDVDDAIDEVDVVAKRGLFSVFQSRNTEMPPFLVIQN